MATQMNSKHRSLLFTAVFFAALVLMAVLGGNVYAAYPTDPAAANTATLAKDFKMDKNLTIPEETFTYTFTAVKVNEDAATTGADANMPTTYTKTLSYTSATTATTTGDTKTATLTLKGSGDGATNLIPALGTTVGTQFTHAGVYEYTVTETTGVNGNIDYSQAEYTLRVYVQNASGEGSTNGLVITGVTVNLNKDDAGTIKDSTTTANKVDPTDPNTNSTATTTQFRFTNTYSKETGTLKITKNTAGNTNAYDDQSRKFPFKATLTKPTTTNSEATTVTAYVVKQGVDPVNGATPITFTYGAEQTFNLANNEELVFGDFSGTGNTWKPQVLPVGTTYTVIEALGDDTGLAQYTPTAIVTYNGGTSVNATAGTAGTTYTIHGDGTGTPAINTTVGETADGNKTAVTNTYKTVTPTGLLIDNLPYILMIGIPVLMVGLYLAAKRRQRKA